MTEPAKLDSEGLWRDAPTSITLSSGERTDPLDVHVEDVHITDIAHALSRQCRYNGHVSGFLSVARHSVWVMQRIETLFASKRLAMTALLHDAAETYLGDMVRPLKHDATLGAAYVTAEAKLEQVIAARFDLPYPFPPVMAEADNYVLMERELGGQRARWTWTSTPNNDEDVFMAYYLRLVAERREQGQ